MGVIAALDTKTDLAAVVVGGAVNEDVMQKIYDVSKNIDLPFTERVGTGSVTAAQYDWTSNTLRAPAQNKWVETAEFGTGSASGVVTYADEASAVDYRYRNHIQVSVIGISVSEMSNAVNSVGGTGSLATQLMNGQLILKRDIEFCATNKYASVAGNGTTTAPVTAGYAAWVSNYPLGAATRTLVDVGGGAGAIGGWNTSTFVFDAPTAGTARGVTESEVRDLVQALRTSGSAGPNQALVAMCADSLKRTISTFMYTSTAKIASMIKQNSEDASQVAVGSVEYWITDFGTLELVPSSIMGDLGTNQYGLYIFDPSAIELVYLKGINTTAGAKLGLVERRTINTYWGTRFNPEQCAAMLDINPATAMVA